MSDMNTKVMKVEGVNLHFGFSQPPTLIILAEGLVPTSGWSNGHLVPYVYITAPADGIWDFDFVAERPSGIVLQIISKIQAKPFVTSAPPWFKGIRVHSSTNSVETTGGAANADDSVRLTTFDMKSESGHEVWPWAKEMHGGVIVMPWAYEVSEGDAALRSVDSGENKTESDK